MDKSKRLRLYSEKDYTETIDFPVELIGRDGVVRRYSYAESIRIYERRIESAHIRYNDREIINAEIYHCSRRLEQIKRSWRQRISSSEREFVEGRPVQKDRELYERGKQFLTGHIERLVAGSDLRPELLIPNLVNLEERADGQVFYVNSPFFHPGTLLYVYRLEAVAGGEEVRPLYLQYLDILRMSEPGPDTEKLVHHEAIQDLAFILTSPRMDPIVRPRELAELAGVPSEHEGGLPEGLAWLESALAGGAELEEGPYRQGLEELRRSNFEAAFTRFKEALDANPFHKDAYWALAALNEYLGHWAEVETYLLMALKYFPDEPLAHFHHGVALFRLNRVREALEAFQEAVRLNVRQSRAYGFLGCSQALLGRYRAAAETLDQGLRAFPRDRSLLKLAVPLHRALRGQNRLLAASIVVGALLVTVALLAPPPVAWAVGTALVVALTGIYLGQRRFYRRLLAAWAQPG